MQCSTALRASQSNPMYPHPWHSPSISMRPSSEPPRAASPAPPAAQGATSCTPNPWYPLSIAIPISPHPWPQRILHPCSCFAGLLQTPLHCPWDTPASPPYLHPRASLGNAFPTQPTHSLPQNPPHPSGAPSATLLSSPPPPSLPKPQHPQTHPPSPPSPRPRAAHVPPQIPPLSAPLRRRPGLRAPLSVLPSVPLRSSAVGAR